MIVKPITNDYVGVFFEFDPKILEIVKSIPGRSWHKEKKFWYFAKDGLFDENIKRLARAGFDVSQVGLANLNRSNRILLNTKLPLYGFQKEMAQFMIDAGSCLVCSFCGSGKTITSIAALAAQGLPANLIVCPKSVLWNWKKEIEQWTPGTKVFVMTGTADERWEIMMTSRVCSAPHFLICTYDTMRIDAEDLLQDEFSAVIFDEVHYLVNVSSQRSKVARKLKSDHKYGLTATPIMNSALDVYGCLQAVKGPVLGTYPSFVDRYCYKDIWNSVKGYKNLDELNYRIRPFIVRKTLDQAQFQIPPKTEINLEVELSEKETATYTKIKQELLLELEKEEISKISEPIMLQMMLVKLGKLQELSDSCELIGESKESSKLEALKDHLVSATADGGKAVIFTKFERMARILERELAEYKPLVLEGGVPDKAREEMIQQFTYSNDRRIFISTEAGGAGINLQRANVLYNFDLPFSLGKLEQRIGRIYRHGQTKPVFIYNLMAHLNGGRKGVDDWVAAKLFKKQELSDRLLIQQIKQELLV